MSVLGPPYNVFPGRPLFLVQSPPRNFSAFFAISLFFRAGSNARRDIFVLDHDPSPPTFESVHVNFYDKVIQLEDFDLYLKETEGVDETRIAAEIHENLEKSRL